ncbi:hypothetical protein LOK49_LG02G02133 [Camellia lanceoleosa]|uniref:Uncharacterized protein n=1 Tax=Camellia lanceoleosa TaxID=1840588 RepID=A0ACC0IQZ1_9ERIC|nr:hypothetical protein LOK49_LG02G02133 [Camellia lanceoleosa]
MWVRGETDGGSSVHIVATTKIKGTSFKPNPAFGDRWEEITLVVEGFGFGDGWVKEKRTVEKEVPKEMMLKGGPVSRWDEGDNVVLIGETKEGWLRVLDRALVGRVGVVMRIRVLGLPIHLRGTVAYRAIGDRCGGFMEVDETMDLLGCVQMKRHRWSLAYQRKLGGVCDESEWKGNRPMELGPMGQGNKKAQEKAVVRPVEGMVGSIPVGPKEISVMGHKNMVGLELAGQMVDSSISRVLEFLRNSIEQHLSTVGTAEEGTATMERGSLTRMVDGLLATHGDGLLQMASTSGLEVVVCCELNDEMQDFGYVSEVVGW